MQSESHQHSKYTQRERNGSGSRTIQKTKLEDLFEVSLGTHGCVRFLYSGVLTLHGLITYYIFFVIELSSRRVKIAGITPHPNEEFMGQCARNLTDCMDGFLKGKKFIIRDRDKKYTPQFDKILDDTDVKVIKLPPSSPNLNSYAERYVLSIKSECLNRFVIFGEKMLRKIIEEFSLYYHTERNHQGIGNQMIDHSGLSDDAQGKVIKLSRLGGVLNYYERKAA